MRKEFLADCKSARQAQKLAPWASEVIKAEGGYWAFESVEDARIWRGQK